MYKYALRSVSTKKIIAQDRRPELLNYLRLGLPDCELIVSDETHDVVSDNSGVWALVPLKLKQLKYLSLEMEQMLATSMLQPVFVSALDHLDVRDSLNHFAREHELDLESYVKTRNLLVVQQKETRDRCWVFFERYARQIARACSSAELDLIGIEIHRWIKNSTKNV